MYGLLQAKMRLAELTDRSKGVRATTSARREEENLWDT
jgi:hypothetical protein